VVQISVQRKPKPKPPPANPQAASADSEFFENFFRNRQPAAPGPRAMGSGTVIGADGYVLTAAHLFDPGDEVTVRLGDGRTLAAEIVGRDRRSDVALLKVPAARLSAATPGDPRRLRLAERVFALGMMPAGKSASVTDGIVSALEVGDGEAAGYLQTTVTLFPSMGGGPLFNLAGELVGVNAMLYTRTSGSGLSFAIPIDEAMRIVTELRANGRVRRGTMGITIQEVTPPIAATYGMDAPAGALIVSASPGGAAERAGIQKGDIIVRFGGETIRSQSQLVRGLSKSKPGERVTIRVRRMKDVREEDLFVTLDEAPE
jgi:serine protease Do